MVSNSMVFVCLRNSLSEPLDHTPVNGLISSHWGSMIEMINNNYTRPIRFQCSVLFHCQCRYNHRQMHLLIESLLPLDNVWKCCSGRKKKRHSRWCARFFNVFNLHLVAYNNNYQIRCPTNSTFTTLTTYVANGKKNDGGDDDGGNDDLWMNRNALHACEIQLVIIPGIQSIANFCIRFRHGFYLVIAMCLSIWTAHIESMNFE